MKRFTLIWKNQFLRTRAMDVTAESLSKMKLDLDPIMDVWVEQVIDWENQVVIPVVLKRDGTLIEVPEGDFGEATPAEYFEEMAEVTDGD